MYKCLVLICAPHTHTRTHTELVVHACVCVDECSTWFCVFHTHCFHPTLHTFLAPLIALIMSFFFGFGFMFYHHYRHHLLLSIFLISPCAQLYGQEHSGWSATNHAVSEMCLLCCTTVSSNQCWINNATSSWRNVVTSWLVTSFFCDTRPP